MMRTGGGGRGEGHGALQKVSAFGPLSTFETAENLFVMQIGAPAQLSAPLPAQTISQLPPSPGLVIQPYSPPSVIPGSFHSKQRTESLFLQVKEALSSPQYNMLSFAAVLLIHGAIISQNYLIRVLSTYSEVLCCTAPATPSQSQMLPPTPTAAPILPSPIPALTPTSTPSPQPTSVQQPSQAAVPQPAAPTSSAGLQLATNVAPGAQCRTITDWVAQSPSLDAFNTVLRVQLHLRISILQAYTLHGF